MSRHTKNSRCHVAEKGLAALELMLILPLLVALLAAILYVGNASIQQMELANQTRAMLWGKRFSGEATGFVPYEFATVQGRLSREESKPVHTGLIFDRWNQRLHSSHLMFVGTWDYQTELQSDDHRIAEQVVDQPLYRPVVYTQSENNVVDEADPDNRQTFLDFQSGKNRIGHGLKTTGTPIFNHLPLPSLPMNIEITPRGSGGTSKERDEGCLCNSPPKKSEGVELHRWVNGHWVRIIGKEEVEKQKKEIAESNQKITVIIHGMRNNSEADWIREMAEALDGLKDANGQKATLVYQIAWPRMSGKDLPFPFNFVVGAASPIFIPWVSQRGSQLLFECLEAPPRRTHLIGHSHGAHVAGNMGIWVNGVRRITCLDPSDSLPHNLFMFGITNTWKPEYAADFVDSYKSSKIAGSELTFGTDNFYLAMPNKTIGLDAGENHSYACEWYRDTILHADETPFGYQWERGSWDKYISREPRLQVRSGPWKGVIQNEDGKPAIQGLTMWIEKTGTGFSKTNQNGPSAGSGQIMEPYRYPGCWQNVYAANGMLFGITWKEEKDNPNYRPGGGTWVDEMLAEVSPELLSQLFGFVGEWLLGKTGKEIGQWIGSMLQVIKPNSRHFEAMLELEITQACPGSFDFFQDVPLFVCVRNNADNRAASRLDRFLGQRRAKTSFWLTESNRSIPDPREDVLIDTHTDWIGYDIGETKPIRVTISRTKIARASLELCEKREARNRRNRILGRPRESTNGGCRMIVEVASVYSDTSREHKSGDMYYGNNITIIPNRWCVP